MHPDLGVEPLKLAVERLGQEFELGIAAVGARRAAVMRRLLELDQRAAGGRQLLQLGVHDVAQIEDHLAVRRVVLVPQHAGEHRRTDRAELDRAVGEALGDLPQRGVFQRPAGQLVGDDRRLIGLLNLVEDAPGLDRVAPHPALRGRAVALDPAQPLDRIEEPRLAADREVEAAVAVGDDVEPGGLLGVDDRGDGVEILLAEQRVAHRRLERAAVEADVVPQRPGIRAGDRGRQNHVPGGFQHGALMSRI